MRFIISTFLSLALLTSCEDDYSYINQIKKEEYLRGRNALIGEKGWSPNYGNSGEYRYNFNFTTYYSSIDTLSTYQINDNSLPKITFSYELRDSTLVIIHINNQLIKALETSKRMNEEYNLWTSEYRIRPETKLKNGDILKAEISIGNKKYIEAIVAVENAVFSDILGVKFETTKEEVIFSEKNRYLLYSAYGGLYNAFYFYENTPKSLSYNFSTNLYKTGDDRYSSTNSQYNFEDDKLSSVIEYYRIFENSISMHNAVNRLNNYSHTLGLKEEIVLSENGKLAKEYKWTKNGLLFEIVADTELNTQIPIIGIKYSKKQ